RAACRTTTRGAAACRSATGRPASGSATAAGDPTAGRKRGQDRPERGQGRGRRRVDALAQGLDDLGVELRVRAVEAVRTHCPSLSDESPSDDDPISWATTARWRMTVMALLM